MQKDHSRFESSLFIPKPRPVKSVKKLFLVSLFFLGFSFFSAKLYYDFSSEFSSALSFKSPVLFSKDSTLSSGASTFSSKDSAFSSRASAFFQKLKAQTLSVQKLSSQKAGAQKLSSKDKESHTLPLLLSLKGREGPRLARVSVSIYLDSQNLKEPFGKEIENLENQLLFLLSGQSIARLSNKDFQSQIQNQLNLFLSHQMIQDLNIETELLNKTRSSL